MLTLAIETSGPGGGVALSRGTTPLASVAVSSSETHSRRLIPCINWLLERAGMKMEELQCVAASLGPGSFTGIRIGLATARGLSLALGIPLAGVPTMDALAAAIPPISGTLLCPLVDARNFRFYTSCYVAEEDGSCWKRLLPFHISTASDFHDRLQQEGFLYTSGMQGHDFSQIMFTGDAVSTCGDQIRDVFSIRNTVFVPEYLRQPAPGVVAAISERYLNAGEVQGSCGPQPIYVRLSQAEEKRAEQTAAASD